MSFIAVHVFLQESDWKRGHVKVGGKKKNCKDVSKYIHTQKYHSAYRTGSQKDSAKHVQIKHQILIPGVL